MNCIRMSAITLALFAYGTAAGAVGSASAHIRPNAPKGITEAFYACIDKADYDSLAVAACLSAEEDVQDARLNRTYKALMGKLDSEARKELVNSERAWLAFDGKSSRLESTLYGSEVVANLEVSQRRIFRKCARANTLDRYLSLASDE